MNNFATILVLALVSMPEALSKTQTKGDITFIAKDCGSVGGNLISVTMDDCYGDQDDRCLVTKGQTVRGQLTFEAHKPTSKLDCQIFGIIGGIMIPFPGGCPVKDGCSDLSSGTCPIEAGETFVYNIEMFIDPIFPSVKVDGKWTLKDGSGNNFVCLIVPIEIE